MSRVIDVRALILHSGNLYGGIETALVSLALGCREHRAAIEPSFALCFDDGRVAGELRDAGAVVHSLGATRLSRPWQVYQARTRLRRLLASTPFDICIAPSSWTLAIFGPVIREHNLPLVLWAHDRWTADRWLDRLALRHRPALIIANSRYTADGMKATLPGVPVQLVYYALASSPIVTSRRRQIRAELATPDDAVVIVQVGRLDPYKGHGLLIDALSRLPASIPWRCWIVGGADTQVQRDYLAQLETSAARGGVSDRVTFTGARHDISAVLAAADIFCHPNVAPEPFGIVFIEALRACLPVIGSASGGVLDIVTEECGRLVPPGDVSALAAVLTELLESRDLRLKLGAGGPERASTLCDIDGRVADLAHALATVA